MTESFARDIAFFLIRKLIEDYAQYRAISIFAVAYLTGKN